MNKQTQVPVFILMIVHRGQVITFGNKQICRHRFSGQILKSKHVFLLTDLKKKKK